MEPPSRSTVIVVSADISGLSAAKVLAENSVVDIIILEATDRVGRRIRKEEFDDVNVELGVVWVTGVGGKEFNSIWELAKESGLRTYFSDYSNARYDIYNPCGKIFPSAITADSYTKAVESAIQKLKMDEFLGCLLM